MLANVLTVARKAHTIFVAGSSIAKTMLKICTVGVIATATLIAQLIGLDDNTVMESEGAEPP